MVGLGLAVQARPTHKYALENPYTRKKVALVDTDVALAGALAGPLLSRRKCLYPHDLHCGDHYPHCTGAGGHTQVHLT